MKMTFFSPRLFLALAVALGSFVVSVRVVDVLDKVSSGSLVVSVSPQAVAKESHAAENSSLLSTPPAEEATASRSAAGVGGAKDTKFSSIEMSSDAELAILRQLASRREQLETRSRELDVRESLIKVSEQRVEQKIGTLKTLRKQVQSLINQAEGEQQTQLENLVKIYETMKPNDAARIFETLDMPVLLGVIQRMKPAKTALVMARLAPEKAKQITIALTRRDQLPKVK